MWIRRHEWDKFNTHRPIRDMPRAIVVIIIIRYHYHYQFFFYCATERRTCTRPRTPYNFLPIYFYPHPRACFVASVCPSGWVQKIKVTSSVTSVWTKKKKLLKKKNSTTESVLNASELDLNTLNAYRNVRSFSRDVVGRPKSWRPKRLRVRALRNSPRAMRR